MKPRQKVWLMGEPIITNLGRVPPPVAMPAAVLESASLHHLGATLDELAADWRCPICGGAAPASCLCDECERAISMMARGGKGEGS